MRELKISGQSIKSHLSRIKKKFGVSDRLQLALRVIRRWPVYLGET
jgi:DNA-binding CsgD family transcriptional regulator